jgi:hypothetical protein
VAAVKFDFTNPGSENGYCGYAAITVFGKASLAPAVPAVLSARMVTPNSFVMNVGSLVVGRNYLLQTTTNLASAAWETENNFVASSVVAAITNATVNFMQKYYRLVGY